ncbi:D-alanyl-D-alanine carboxypeptidase/D-alanyl-D-alanine-endopeptidase [Prolixibacteraceae bacterium JC049]|nr:D-alanyl-D-alanine carboxypeptidase/D-alanyl-D-alanine-endopeptidase [Prolixibacteraceae bacterium JC049]
MIRLLKIVFTFLFIFQSTTLIAQNKAQAFLQKMVQKKELQNASISAYAIDLNTQQVILETTPQLSIVPASILKLVTTASALEILGADYQFTTTLAYSGKIKSDSTLYGDLIIKGGGDPAFCSEYFKEQYDSIWINWAKALKEKGIKKVNGKICFDVSIFDNEQVPNTWIWEDIGNYYGAGASGLSVADNKYTIVFQSLKQANRPTKIVEIIPSIPNLKIENQVLSSDVPRDNAYVFGSPFEAKRVVRGTIPKNRKRFRVKASMPNPPIYAATLMQKELEKAGIQFQSKEILQWQNAKKTVSVVAEHQSPQLIDIIRQTNHKSINLFAEHLLKTIGLRQLQSGSTKAGTKAIKAYWEEQSLDVSNLFLVDGSGLSRFNAITAQQMTSILACMNKTVFESTLPQAGKEGTLEYRFRNLPNSIIVKAKTGSMTRARALAGYIHTEDRDIAFAILVNNYAGKSSKIEQDIDSFVLSLTQD